jgi:hypothetical protein
MPPLSGAGQTKPHSPRGESIQVAKVQKVQKVNEVLQVEEVKKAINKYMVKMLVSRKLVVSNGQRDNRLSA